MGFASCEVTYQTYELITCVTEANSESNNSVTITVTNSYDAVLPVECVSEDCWFEFTTDATPTLTDVASPQNVSRGTLHDRELWGHYQNRHWSRILRFTQSSSHV